MLGFGGSIKEYQSSLVGIGKPLSEITINYSLDNI